MNKKMKDEFDIMLDIETLGVERNSIILSVGAVAFNIRETDPDKTIIDTYQAFIDPMDCEKKGLICNVSTVLWWFDCNPEARSKIIDGPNVSLKACLNGLNDFFRAGTITPISGQYSSLRVWANSPSFDCAILANAYSVCAMKKPWAYTEERDVRTLVSLGKIMGFDLEHVDSEEEYIRHDSLDDAISQSLKVSRLYNLLSQKHLHDD